VLPASSALRRVAPLKPRIVLSVLGSVTIRLPFSSSKDSDPKQKRSFQLLPPLLQTNSLTQQGAESARRVFGRLLALLSLPQKDT
jgi:hypothetical protein